MDCQCQQCKKRYSVNVCATDKYRVQCPYCNGGYYLWETTAAEWRGHWATLRAQVEGRCFSLVGKRITASGYSECLMPIWNKAEDVPAREMIAKLEQKVIELEALQSPIA